MKYNLLLPLLFLHSLALWSQTTLQGTVINSDGEAGLRKH